MVGGAGSWVGKVVGADGSATGSVRGAAMAAVILSILPELLRQPPSVWPWGLIVLAPALTHLGLKPVAVQLFVLYWGMSSFITPPVALAAYAASAIARASFMKVGWQACRLGIVIYLVPFFFVIAPALVLQGPLTELWLLLPTSIVGIALLASGVEGHLWFLGKLSVLERLLVGVAGLCLAMPGWQLDLAGVAIMAAAIPIHAARVSLPRRKAGQEAVP